ncbi:protein FAM133-like [Montipora capricornis]|uniref:protein FAM133-like n=1 Tax=Montipora capricornis TaxID=246305 RepID=UPI0035F2119D
MICFYFIVSSTSDTPGKLKRQSSQDVKRAGRVKGGRKTTEGEKGEIFSDISDAESKQDDKRRRPSLSKEYNKKEIAIEADDISDSSSDSESRKSNKQQKYSTLQLDVVKKRTGKEENVEDALDSKEKLKDDLERGNLSSRNPSSEKKAKDVDFVESKGTWLLSFMHGTMIVVWKVINLVKGTLASYEMNSI